MPTTRIANSPSYADINGQVQQCNDGDIVKVLAGSATWAVGTLLTVNKNISIIGAGPEQTIITAPAANIITFNTQYQAAAGGTTPEVRLSNLRINSNGLGAGSGVPSNGQIQINGWSQNVRLDHLAFNATTQILWIAGGWTYGVMDHCYTDPGVFIGPLVMGSHGHTPGITPFVAPTVPAGVDVSSGGQGDVSYTHRGIDHWATANNWYFEDNFIQKVGHFFGSYEKGGVWYVARHNSTRGSFSGHGNDTTGPRRRSERSQELYNNYFGWTAGGAQSISLNEWRGASGHAFNNRFGVDVSKPWTGGGTVPFAVDSYRSASNYGGSGFKAYNSSDGTGPFDVNDRSTVNIFNGSQLPDCACTHIDPDTNKKDGSDATNKPCVPGKADATNPYGSIFAAGTGASSVNNATVILPGMPPVSADQLVGYVVRDPSDPLPGARLYGPNSTSRRWGVIVGHAANTTTFTISTDNSSSNTPTPIAFLAGGNWEIRRSLHVIDEPGSGKTDLVTSNAGSPGNPIGPVPFNLEWEYVYQWGNQVQNGFNNWDNAVQFMDAQSGAIAGVAGTEDFWGEGNNQQSNKANRSARGLRNGLRTVGYNTTQGLPNPVDDVPYTYPVIDLSALTQAQKDGYRRIGADNDPLLPAHSALQIGYNSGSPVNGQVRVPSTTTYWGYTYPHPLASGTAGPAVTSITSIGSTTFVAGTAGQTFQVTSSGFTGSPTFALSNITDPNNGTSLPTNVAFSSAGKFSGTATGATVGDYTMTITASHAPDTDAVQDNFLLRIKAGNTAPTASITAPTGGSVFSPSDSVTVTGEANDSDGYVATLELFDGTTSLGSTSNTTTGKLTYSVSQSFSNGSHSLTAKATDNSGDATTSSAVAITIQQGPPAAPSIAVISG